MIKTAKMGSSRSVGLGRGVARRETSPRAEITIKLNLQKGLDMTLSAEPQESRKAKRLIRYVVLGAQENRVSALGPVRCAVHLARRNHFQGVFKAGLM